jgi:hypothetical protein
MSSSTERLVAEGLAGARPRTRPARTGAPGHAAHVLALQRTAGNRAVAGLARRVVARKVLDQPDPVAAWHGLTPQFWFSSRGSDNPELLHIDALLERLKAAGEGSNTMVRKRDVLLRLRRVLDQWLTRGQREHTLKDRVSALVTLRDEVDDAIRADASEDWIDESWGGDTVPTSAIDPNRNAFDEYVDKGGMPAAQKQTFLDDYKRIRALLTDKHALRRYFGLLEARLGEGYSLSGALKLFEAMVGFANLDVIPLGLLDSPTFLGLIRRGIAFKDFGAGIPHGEWTHRLQWFAIAAEITEGFTKAKGAGYNHTPLELYRYLGSPDTTVGHGRYKKSIFGNLLDLGGSAGDRYNQPDRLHMDLLGLKWAPIEDRVFKGENWTVLEEYLAAHSDLPLLRDALLGKVRKRAAEAAEARRLHGGNADTQYKADYRQKKENQVDPYARDPVLSGPSAATAVLVRNR